MGQVNNLKNKIGFGSTEFIVHRSNGKILNEWLYLIYYNSRIRKRFAGIGDTYDETRDAFITPKPYPSWILNETTCEWEAPVNKTTYYLLELNGDGTGPSTFTEHDAEGNPIEAHQIWSEENQSWGPHEPNFATTEVRVNPDPSTKYQPIKPNVDE